MSQEEIQEHWSDPVVHDLRDAIAAFIEPYVDSSYPSPAHVVLEDWNIGPLNVNVYDEIAGMYQSSFHRGGADDYRYHVAPFFKQGTPYMHMAAKWNAVLDYEGGEERCAVALAVAEGWAVPDFEAPLRWPPDVDSGCGVTLRRVDETTKT